MTAEMQARRSLRAQYSLTLWLKAALALALRAILIAPALHPIRAAEPVPTLDLSDYEQTFNETFSTLSISAAGPATTWTAHTPWHGDFGDAVFDDPGPNGPFSLGPHGLRITASRDAGGRWHSGLISSMDKDGPGQKGFAQRYGYFEMRARLPDGEGAWSAFWLIGTEKSRTASEIDVIEFYGGFPVYFHNVLHLFRDGADLLRDNHLAEVSPGKLASSFNDFGVLIEKDRTSFYLNRRVIWQRPTPPAYDQPFYILANLAIGGGWPHDRLSSPTSMEIERIAVFAQKRH